MQTKRLMGKHAVLFDAYLMRCYQPQGYRALFTEMLQFEAETGQTEFTLEYFDHFYRWAGAKEDDPRRVLLQDFLLAVSRDIVSGSN